MDTDVAVTLRPHPVSCNQFFVIVFVHCIFLSVITKVKAKRIHIKKVMVDAGPCHSGLFRLKS